MAIEVTKDPRTRQEVTFVVGKVEGVFFNALKETKTYSGPNGPWTPTHTVNIIVDGTKIGFGLTEKESINSKDIDGNYHTLEKGMEVSVEITEVGEYKGNPQYSSKASKVTVLDATVKETKAPASTPYQRKPKDDTGVVAGNARTAAYNFIVANSKWDDNVEDYIKFFADLAHNKRVEYASNNQDLDSFQVGVSVGQAITTAASCLSSLEDVEAFVDNYLSSTIPASIEVVKALPKDEVVDVRYPGKPVKAKPVTRSRQRVAEPDDYNDDIPF